MIKDFKSARILTLVYTLFCGLGFGAILAIYTPIPWVAFFTVPIFFLVLDLGRKLGQIEGLLEEAARLRDED